MMRNSNSIKSVLGSCSVLAVLAIQGCTEKNGIFGHNPEAHTSEAYVNFRIEPESGIDNVNVYAYREGKLVGTVYSVNRRKVGMYLSPGKEYDFYVLANSGMVDPPEDRDSVQSLVCKIGSMDALAGNSLPMSSHVKAEIGSGRHSDVHVCLSGIVSEVGVAIDTSGTDGFVVRSVRLVNAAADYRPFSCGGPAAYFLKEGYSASDKEIADINMGRTVYVRLLENCQGELFPSNDDSRNKTPANLPEDLASKCSYMEITASRHTAGGGESEAVYRFCLGQDAVSDCNLKRNTLTKVTLAVTGDGPDDYEWIVGDREIQEPEIRLFAAGAGGTVIYTDRKGEMSRMKFGTGIWRDVIHAGNRYVMVGSNGWLTCSENGEDWIVAAEYQVDWQAVTYGNGKFVAVGYHEYPVAEGPYPERLAGYVAVSDDGREWSVTEISDFCLLDADYGNGCFVIAGYCRAFGGTVSSGRFLCSPDGREWSEIKVRSRYYPCVVYGNDIFIALDAGMCIRSGDGSSWSSSEFAGTIDMDAMAYGAGTYVAAGRFGTIVCSLDASIWTEAEVPPGRLTGVFYSKGYFIVTSASGSVMISHDGKEWRQTDTGCSCALYCACIL